MRYLFLLYVLLISSVGFSQKVRISGKAPGYVGKDLKVYRIKDYLSDKEALITSTTVKDDSTFGLSFFTEDIEKIVLKSENNWSFLYVQPNGTYRIVFPDHNEYEPDKPTGNEVELMFFDLDSNDINYKILAFQRWTDYFIGSTYHLRNDKESALFSAELDTFKMNVQAYYDQDTSENSYFLKTYIRYSIAGLDNINTIAERNRFEKYDFYLSKYPVSYTNDIYMNYLTGFYEKIVLRLSNEINEKFYQGVLKSSPTIIFNSLSGEYTLRNPRIRELVMIQALSEAYYSKEYPKTNIETILDSLSQNSLFEAHEDIAKNVLDRLTDLIPGSEAPNFVLTDSDGQKTLADYEGKHLYLHFLDARSKENMKELKILSELQEAYASSVQIVSIYKQDDKIPQGHLKELGEATWDVFALPSDHPIFDRYRITNFPQYVLIDASGHVVSSPALGPTPNGEYETIDRTFFYLKKAYDQMNEEH